MSFKITDVYPSSCTSGRKIYVQSEHVKSYDGEVLEKDFIKSIATTANNPIKHMMKSASFDE